MATCAALESLDVSGNHVEDLSSLTQLEALSVLKADSNAITELPDMTGTALSQLSLSHNQLTALPDMTDMVYLNFVNVDYNAIRDLTVLAECPALVQVDAFANPVSDSVDALTEHSIIVNYDPTYTLPEEKMPEGESDEEA